MYVKILKTWNKLSFLRFLGCGQKDGKMGRVEGMEGDGEDGGEGEGKRIMLIFTIIFVEFYIFVIDGDVLFLLLLLFL